MNQSYVDQMMTCNLEDFVLWFCTHLARDCSKDIDLQIDMQHLLQERFKKEREKK